MRLGLKINGIPRVVAAVSGPGYLSAHLNMAERPKENDYSKTVRLAGTQTLETETVHLHWSTLELQVGDRVELQVMDDGEGNPPEKVRRSSEDPRNLFSEPALAREMTELASDFESRLLRLLDKSKEQESADEHGKLTTAVGYVIYEIGNQLLYPIYRRHKELIPDELKGDLL